MTTGNVSSRLHSTELIRKYIWERKGICQLDTAHKFLLPAWDNYSAEHAKVTQAKSPSHSQCDIIG